MNSTPQIASLSVYVIAGAVWLLAVYVIYQRNLRSLDANKNSRKVRPEKVHFLLSWSVYSLVFYVPLILIFWVLSREFPTTFALAMLFMFLSIAPAAYPYYTVARFKSKINGATRWGWRWKRVEIAFDELDVSKTRYQPLGIAAFHSTSGVKILTLGLSKQQISTIMNSANEVQDK